jgi:hypothetical protein
VLFTRENALALAARHESHVRHIRESQQIHSLGLNAGGVDFLLTGFRSFTQDERGTPRLNPTARLLQMISHITFDHHPDFKHLLTIGLARVGGFRCVTAIGDVDHATPAAFVELARAVKPKAVLSLGLGPESILEVGATNRINASRPVYDCDGRNRPGVFPAGETLDEGQSPDFECALPWGESTLERLRRVITMQWQGEHGSAGPLGRVTVASRARPDNDYLCNSTAWLFARILARPATLPPLNWITAARGEATVTVPGLSGLGIQKSGFLHLAPVPAPSEGYFLAAANLLVDVTRAILP